MQDMVTEWCGVDGLMCRAWGTMMSCDVDLQEIFGGVELISGDLNFSDFMKRL